MGEQVFRPTSNAGAQCVCVRVCVVWTTGEYCYPGVLLVSVFMLAAAAQRATIPSLAKAAIALLTAVAACMFARALIASFGGHNNRQEAPALQFNVLAFVVVHVGLLGVTEYGIGTVVIRLLGHRSSKTKPSLETTTVSSFALLVCCYATCTLAVCGIINFPVGCGLLLLLAPACVLVMPTPIEDASRRLTFARCPLPQLAKLWLALSSPCGVAVAVTAGSLWEHWAQHPGVGVMDSVFGRSATNPLTPGTVGPLLVWHVDCLADCAFDAVLQWRYFCLARLHAVECGYQCRPWRCGWCGCQSTQRSPCYSHSSKVQPASACRLRVDPKTTNKHYRRDSLHNTPWPLFALSVIPTFRVVQYGPERMHGPKYSVQ